MKRILIHAAAALLATGTACAYPTTTIATTAVTHRAVSVGATFGRDLADFKWVRASIDDPLRRGKLPLPTTLALVALGLLGVLRLRP
jgi:hypothetical protein